MLVTEFTQTLYSVASDVYVSIIFNPELIEEYRLVGYDNKKNVLSEKGNELEGGEVGSGAGNTILFEVAVAKADTLHKGNGMLASLSVHYRVPDDTSERTLNYNCSNNYVAFEKLNKDLQFATSVAMLGLKLRQSKYFVDVDWESIRNIALKSLTPGDYLQTEFVGLIDKSKVIYYEKKKRRWRKLRKEE